MAGTSFVLQWRRLVQVDELIDRSIEVRALDTIFAFPGEAYTEIVGVIDLVLDSY